MSKNTSYRTFLSGLADISYLFIAIFVTASASARPFELRAEATISTEATLPQESTDGDSTIEEEQENEGEIEVDPDFAPPSQSIVEHGEVPTDATPISTNSETAGIIDTRYPGDVDIFLIRLTQREDITITTTGPTDTLGILLDTSQRIITTDDNSGQGKNLRMQTTLSPGTYFIRVEGSWGDRGPYTLHLKPQR